MKFNIQPKVQRKVDYNNVATKKFHQTPVTSNPKLNEIQHSAQSSMKRQYPA